jgi:ligand-binding sensor domain-containing protein
VLASLRMRMHARKMHALAGRIVFQNSASNATGKRSRMCALIHKMKLPRRRAAILAALGASLVIAAVVIYIVRLNRSIAIEQDRQTAATRVEVEENSLRAPSTDGMTLYLNASDVRAVATFAGIRYLATSGGLMALDEGGNVKRRYSTLDGLPDNDLTALAVFRERLFAGTASAGLVAFDGNGFTGYRFTKPRATHVTVLVTTESELLIGTLDGGLFEYDGQRFSRRFNSTAGANFSRTTALLPFESRLYIGTQDSGLYIWREAHIEHITTTEGLPSPHVTAIISLPPNSSDKGSVAAATDFGVVALNEANEIRPISNRPNVTSLAVSGEHLWAGLFGGGLVDLNANAGRRDLTTQSTSSPSEAVGVPASVPATVCASGGQLWALTPEGAFARDERATRPAFTSVAGSLVGDRVLTAGHITALASDGASRLWVGYFDRGIDLIAPETNERLSHIEDDRVREINYLAFDRSEDRMLAATSRGLIVFGGGLKQTVMTREQGGLINDSVAHVTLADIDSLLFASTGAQASDKQRGRALVLATAGGLTEVIGGRSRSITAFHGLASNHLYASASLGSRLFVGSLAGLIELEGLRVVRTYKTSNSRLSHDWVTALAEADGTLYVGTNGGGIDALLPTGEWINFADELGKFEVNQNAMHYDGERLYVGTGDRGILVYNTRDRRWTRVSAGLASQNVTAITSDDRFIYVGTLNGLVRIEKRVL